MNMTRMDQRQQRNLRISIDPFFFLPDACIYFFKSIIAYIVVNVCQNNLIKIPVFPAGGISTSFEATLFRMDIYEDLFYNEYRQQHEWPFV